MVFLKAPINSRSSITIYIAQIFKNKTHDYKTNSFFSVYAEYKITHINLPPVKKIICQLIIQLT